VPGGTASRGAPDGGPGCLGDGVIRDGVIGDGDFGRRGPAWAPLLFTLSLHLLLVLGWLLSARPGFTPPSPPREEARFVLVAPLRARPAVPAVQPASARPRRSAPPVAQVRSAPRPPVRSAPQEPPAPTEAVADAMGESAEAPPADTVAPGTRLPGDLLASSKRMAGRVDRALRQGASPITAEPERKWERFAEAVAGARTTSAGAVTLASYTSPDGVVIYRKTVGDKVRCYRSGSVGGLVTGFGAADLHTAGTTTCPSGVGWKRL